MRPFQGSIVLRIALVVSFALTFVGTGCRPPRWCPDASAPTPEQAALPYTDFTTFNILAVRDFADGKVVVYEDEYPDGTTRLGASVVQPRIGCGWVMRAGTNLETFINLPDSYQALLRLIDLNVPSMIISGHILDPRIATVEVTFDTGVTKQDVVRDNIFLIDEPAARFACSMRLLDHQGQAIEHIDDLPEVLHPGIPHSCPSP